MRLRLEARDVLTGLIVYPLGDTIGAALVGALDPVRCVGMLLLGGTLYAWEIPACFRWIERRAPGTMAPTRRAVVRTTLALCYFNPLWIARHLAFITLFMGRWDDVNPSLLRTAALSWAVNIPLAVLGNFVIQVALPLKHRFLGSAVFSALMVIYYALCQVWFA